MDVSSNDRDKQRNVICLGPAPFCRTPNFDVSGEDYLFGQVWRDITHNLHNSLLSQPFPQDRRITGIL